MGALLKIFLNLFGIIWIAAGTLMIFVPDLIKKNVFSKLKDAPLKKLSAIPIAFGVLFLLSASYCRYRLFIIVLGILSLLKGISLIIFTKKMEKLTDRFIKANDNTHRAFGVLYIIIGAIVLKGI